MLTDVTKIPGMCCCGLIVLLVSWALPRGNNEAGGMIIGGIFGGVLGHEIGSGPGKAVATIIGTMIGTSIGGNPDTGYQYRVVPTRTYDIKSAPCREYIVDASMSGKTEKIMVRPADRPMEAGR
jgi:uncharacterized protein YcfJ